MAALHGLMGYFHPIVRLKPIPESIPPRFEVAEIINLQWLKNRIKEHIIFCWLALLIGILVELKVGESSYTKYLTKPRKYLLRNPNSL